MIRIQPMQTELYKQLLSLAHDPILALDEECMVFYANPAAISLLKIQDQSSFPALQLVPERNRALVTDALKQVMNGQTIDFAEMHLVDFNCNEIPVSIEIRPILENEACKAMGVVIQDRRIIDLVQDIREDHDEKYKLLTEHSTDLISTHEPDGVYTYVSPSVVTLLGYNTEELIGKSAYELFFPQDLQAIMNSHNTIQVSEDVATVQYRIKKKDGSYTWFETTSKTIRNQLGEPEQIIAHSRDISRRKLLEIERANLFTHSIDLLGVSDLNGYFVQVNPAWTEKLGWSEEELLSKPWIEFIHPDDREKGVEAAIKLQKGEVLKDFKQRNIVKNGGVRFMSFNAFPLLEAGQIFVSGRDITEQKRLEDELKFLATTDSLTGVSNRRQVLQMLDREIDRAKRHGGRLALLLIDIDHFKKINDQFGHQAGDLVLKNFGRIAKDCLRQHDLVGRYGGEEFLMVLVSANKKDTALVAERVRSSVAAQQVRWKEHKISYSISVGVAVQDETPPSAYDLIQKADDALYRAKDAGRNRVVFFEA
jgi:diguanylate cyclase (GGDEF)-like protein/PAS domain S-box-containing protein